MRTLDYTAGSAPAAAPAEPGLSEEEAQDLIDASLAAAFGHVVNTAQLDKTDDTALANSLFAFPVSNGGLYLARLQPRYQAGSSGDAKLGLTYPVGSTGEWGGFGPDVTTASTLKYATAAIATPIAFGGAGAATPSTPHLEILLTAGADGTVTLQFAQNTSSGTASSLLTGGVLRWERLA